MDAAFGTVAVTGSQVQWTRSVLFHAPLTDADITDLMNNGLNALGVAVEPAGKLAVTWGVPQAERVLDTSEHQTEISGEAVLSAASVFCSICCNN